MKIEQKHKKTIIFGLSQGVDIATEIAQNNKFNMKLGKISFTRFPDSEILVRSVSSVRNCHTFVVQSFIDCRKTKMSTNDAIMECLIFIDSLKRASARSINLIIPYFGYARQDRKSLSHEPISAKLVANLLENAGATRVTTFDIHKPQLQGFFDIPFDNLTAIPFFIQYLEKKFHKEISDKKLVIVNADAGANMMAMKIAKKLKLPIAFVDKRRISSNKIEIIKILGSVKGKIPIIVDDIICTGTTISTVAKILYSKFESKEIILMAVHSLMTKGAIEQLEKKYIKRIVITNTIKSKLSKKERDLLKIDTICLNNFVANVTEVWLNSSSISGVYRKMLKNSNNLKYD